MKAKLKDIACFVLDRRMSFAFSVTSIVYGLYHFFNQNLLNGETVYNSLSILFGVIGGGWFGLIFVGLGTLKLIGLIADITILILPMYFALLALWVILGLCFFVSFLQGYTTPSFIYSFGIALLSTGIIAPNKKVTLKGGGNY